MYYEMIDVVCFLVFMCGLLILLLYFLDVVLTLLAATIYLMSCGVAYLIYQAIRFTAFPFWVVYKKCIETPKESS